LDLDNWKLDGVKVSSSDYWLPLGEPYMSFIQNGSDTFQSHPDNKKRSTIIGSLLKETGNGIRGVLNNILGETDLQGVPTSWVGITRLHTDFVSTEWIENYTLFDSSEPNWQFIHCSGDFGVDGITITPFQETVTVLLKLHSLETYPFFAPALCDSVTVDWEDDNIVTVAVYFLNSNGERLFTHAFKRNI